MQGDRGNRNGSSENEFNMARELIDDCALKGKIDNDDDPDLLNASHGATSRGSVKLVYTVITSFDQKKKDIVSGINFGGLLSFPQLTQLNLKFSKWLLTRVDESTSSIVIDKNRVCKFGDSDVHNIFGVPAAGRDVRDKHLDRSDAAINIVRTRLGLNGKEARSLKAAQAILLKDYGEAMEQQEVDAFKTAFIVFIMGHFFAPTSKHNYCSIDYWPALVDPNLIDSFNWGKYIIEELCDAAKKLKSDIRKKVSVSNITGCSLFLQVFYLDSVNLGALNIPDGTFPLIKVITIDRLKSMIAADTVHKPGTKHDVEFRASLPKRREVAAHGERPLNTEQMVDDAEWNTAKQLCQMLKISNEGLTEVYQQLQRRKDYLMTIVSQDINNFYTELGEIARRHDKNKDIVLPGDAAFNQLCNDAGVGSSHIPASTYLPSSEVHFPKRICIASSSDTPVMDTSFMDLLSTDVNISHDMVPIDDVQCELSLCSRTDRPMRQKCSSFMFKDTRFTDNINLNAKTLDSDLGTSPFKKRRARVMSSKCTISSLIEQKEYPPGFCEEFHKWVTSIRGGNIRKTLWIMHDVPSYIEMTAEQIIQQLSGDVDFDHDLFNLMMRCFNQAEDGATEQPLVVGRKHYMETDVVTRLMAGEAIHHSVTIRQLFIGDHVKYDLPNCKLIMLPAYTNFAWACYAIDLIEKRLTVYDPTLTDEGSKDIQGLHLEVCGKIKEAMGESARHFFESWEFDWNGLSVSFVSGGDKLSERHRSGIHTLNFCKLFDGSAVRKDMRQEDELKFASYLLYDLMHLKGNKALRPQEFIQVVDA